MEKYLSEMVTNQVEQCHENESLNVAEIKNNLKLDSEKYHVVENFYNDYRLPNNRIGQQFKNYRAKVGEKLGMTLKKIIRYPHVKKMFFASIYLALLSYIIYNWHQMPYTSLLSMFSYATGVNFGMKAARDLKKHNDTKGEYSISGYIYNAVIAALFIALPTLLDADYNRGCF